MPAPFTLSILAADHPFYEGECLSLDIPTTEGQYGIMANHSNMIAGIVPGILTAVLGGKEPGERVVAAVTAGIAKVEKNKVLILVDSIERPEEIDLKRAEREYEAAMKALKKKAGEIEHSLAEAKLMRAVNRLRAKKNYGGGS